MIKFLFCQSFADQVGRLIENEADFRAIAQNRQLIAKIREIRGLVKDGRDEEAQKKKADLPLIYFFGTRKEGVTRGRKAADLDDMGIFTGHDYDELPPGATLRQVLSLIVQKIHNAGYDWKELLALVVLSPRHTEEHPRFRVLLRVPEELRTGDTKRDAERMEALINLEEYGIHSDPGCKPTKARPWYMVDEASIHYLNARVLFGSETEPVTTTPAPGQLCECHGEEPFGDCLPSRLFQGPSQPQPLHLSSQWPRNSLRPRMMDMCITIVLRNRHSAIGWTRSWRLFPALSSTT